VQQLKYLIEHHPDRVRLTHENQGLKAEIKKLKTSSSGKTESSHQKQLARSHQYTLQLERQLRNYLAKGSVSKWDWVEEGEGLERQLRNYVPG